MTPERLEDLKKCAKFYTNSDTIEELLAHIDAQAKQIEQLEKDKARLDWLEREATIETDSMSIWYSEGDFGRNDLREAIDNAKGE